MAIEPVILLVNVLIIIDEALTLTVRQSRGKG